MNWYTCIIHNPNHVTPVQYFYTRAETPIAAEANALQWIFDGDPEMEKPAKRDVIDVPLVFLGKIEPEST